MGLRSRASHADDDGATNDLRLSLAVITCVLVSYHALAHDLSVLALPVLLLLGWLSRSMTGSSWTRPATMAGLAVLFFSPLQLVLLMRYNRLALLAWAVLLCFAGVAGELEISNSQASQPQILSLESEEVLSKRRYARGFDAKSGKHEDSTSPNPGDCADTFCYRQWFLH